MKCKEKNCDGKISKKNIAEQITAPIGCSRIATGNAYPCNKCGRLHWFDGDAIFNEHCKKAFLISKKVVYK